MLGQVVDHPDVDLDMATIFVTIQPTGKNQHHLAINQVQSYLDNAVLMVWQS